jgi:hypothetical protein
MDTVVKTMIITFANALNHHEFLRRLEESGSEHYEIIYHTNVSRLT